MKDQELPIVGFEMEHAPVFRAIQWTDKTDENINLVEVFILADRIHQWIADNPDYTKLNYLTLVCTGGREDAERWVASFDSNLIDGEWFEYPEIYPFASRAPCVEEAIFSAALKVKNFVDKL